MPWVEEAEQTRQSEDKQELFNCRRGGDGRRKKEKKVGHRPTQMAYSEEAEQTRQSEDKQEVFNCRSGEDRRRKKEGYRVGKMGKGK